MEFPGLDRRVRRYAWYLFGLLLVALVPTLVLAARVLGEVTAIKGSYALFGVLLATAVYRAPGRSDAVDGRTSLGGGPFVESGAVGRWALKGVLALVALACLSTYVTGDRLGSVVLALVVGVPVVVYQLLTVGATRAVVTQVVVLFAVGPLTRYLSTGFYFGDGDLLGHVRAVEVLLRTGRVAAIDAVYSTYTDFPALHVVSASVSAVTGLSPYDSLMLLGTVTYLLAIVAVVYLVGSLLSPAEGVAVGFVFAALSLVQFYASYFYPQALATALVVYLFYLVVRRASLPPSLRLSFSVLTVAAVFVLSLAHHVTQILLAGIVALLYAPSALSAVGPGRRLGVNEYVPRVTPVAIALVVGLTHLLLTRTSMITYLVDFASEKVSNPFVSDAGGERVVFGFGTAVPYQDPATALQSLVYVDGVYYIALAALFVLGFVVVLVHYERYSAVAGYVLLGTVGSLFVLRTPLVGVASRLALPLAPFFAIVAGVGLSWIVESVRTRVGTSTTRYERLRHLLVAALVLTVGITGPLVAGDDLYHLHDGPNLWETYSSPEQQVEFSRQELSELRATVGYVDRHTSSVTMLWITREASDRFGGEERSVPTVSAAGIRTDDPLVYRTAWADHQVGYSTDVPGTVVVADWWLSREVGASNKVYTTGQVGMLHGPDGARLSTHSGGDE